MIPTPRGHHAKHANNQDAVAGLLRQKFRESQSRAAQVATAKRAPTHAPSGSPPPGCPMHASLGGEGAGSAASGASGAGGINPANNMPFNLHLPSSSSSSSSSSAEPSSSRAQLSQNRVISTIPRGQSSPAPGASPYDAPSACPVAHDSKGNNSNWEYPSAAQFQAALSRKDKAAPDEHVEMMVMVHNYMNEEAWKLVMDWEKDFGVDTDRCSLLRFQGRPGELSPRARWYGLLGSIMPSRYR